MPKRLYTLIFLLLLLTSGGFYIFIIGQKKDLASKKYPNANVILIVIDALRADHLGCYGYPRETSPEIDKLAKEGIIYTNMLAQSSWTKPATASILTGLHPKSHTAHGNNRIPDEVQLLPEILSQHGYRSYAFASNSFVSKSFGFDQGFEKFFYFQENAKKTNIYISSDEINQSISLFIHQLKNINKNFIYIHYIDPHYPYTPKEKHFSQFNRNEFLTTYPLKEKIKTTKKEERQELIKEVINAYDDEILYNDKMIGQLIQQLKNKKMYSNSIIIITSDHGEEFFEHGNVEHGTSLYDELLKVPLIIHLPDKIHKRIDRIANQVDIVPTVLSLLNIPIPPNIEGSNCLNNQKNTPPFSYAELKSSKINLYSIRSLHNKFIEGFSGQFDNNPHHRWFKDKAILKTDVNTLRLVIQSFYKNRMIQVLLDDKPISKFEITTKKKLFKIPLPNSNQKKEVTIQSLTPCQIPSKLGINNDGRCLAFCIFNSKNINVKDLNSGKYYKEYYYLPTDPREKNNLYSDQKHKKTILRLRKNLKKYEKKQSPRLITVRSGKLSKEQIKALKTLGYINDNGDLK